MSLSEDETGVKLIIIIILLLLLLKAVKTSKSKQANIIKKCIHNYTDNESF